MTGLRLWLGVGVAAVAAVIATGPFAASGSHTITVAAASPIYSTVSEWHVAGNTSASSVAAAGGTSTASARCSLAAAVQVVKRLHLGQAEYLPRPVGKVICGPFTGPGSQAMAASLSSGGTSVTVGCAVFRWAGGAWQLVMESDLATTTIEAAGSDIRETSPVWRKGDPHCCPSGGTEARIWHWKGTRFTASAWKQVKPGKAVTPARASTTGYFKTPSGNIVCLYIVGTAADRPLVECGIKTGLKPPPSRNGRGCKYSDYQGDRVELLATGPAHAIACAGDVGPFAGLVVGAQVLSYGKTWSGSGFRCASAVTGLTCRNKSGHGFFLSRAHWRSF
jgi:hypothetical protein